MSSVSEASFWAKALELKTIDIIMGTMSSFCTPVTDNAGNLIDAYVWQDRFIFIQSRCRQSLSWNKFSSL